MKKLLILLTFLSTIEINAQLCFDPATNFSVGNNPKSVTAADFNGDGKIDLATANFNSKDISILLGTGTGSFGVATNFSLGLGVTDPISIINSDFNGDNKIDLAIANKSSLNVSILLGTGTGSFSSAVNFSVGSGPVGPSSILSADFNGDGKKDLAATNYNPGTVCILFGNGLGSFSSAVNYTTSNGGSNGIVSADFNSDGKIDLATVNYGIGDVSILFGNGIGGFSAATNFTTGSSTSAAITTEDFNLDGKPDVATANNSSNNSSVLLNTGSGSLSAPTNTYSGYCPMSICSADFNGDGAKDLAIPNCAGLFVLLGANTSTFSAPTIFSSSGDPYSIINADLNTDGKQDIIVAGGNTNKVFVHLNCSNVGIYNHNKENLESSIFPNPTDKHFSIISETQSNFIIEIFDLNGRQVLARNINRDSTVDVSNLDVGVYSVIIKNSNFSEIKKLVVVK
jgi:hypothetical protein